MVKRSGGAEYNVSAVSDSGNPSFSEKRYSCEKIGVIQFRIMTGTRTVCILNCEEADAGEHPLFGKLG